MKHAVQPRTWARARDAIRSHVLDAVGKDVLIQPRQDYRRPHEVAVLLFAPQALCHSPHTRSHFEAHTALRSLTLGAVVCIPSPP
jgi:hypothetical protein